jgi:hypothetical protein
VVVDRALGGVLSRLSCYRRLESGSQRFFVSMLLRVLVCLTGSSQPTGVKRYLILQPHFSGIACSLLRLLDEE